MGLEQTEQTGALYASLIDAPAAAIVSDACRTIPRPLAKKPAEQIKKVARGVSSTEAVAASARLWAANTHWAAADKLIKRGK